LGNGVRLYVKFINPLWFESLFASILNVGEDKPFETVTKKNG
jgi:hypothetical protein